LKKIEIRISIADIWHQCLTNLQAEALRNHTELHVHGHYDIFDSFLAGSK
jgi:hypothetical protein